MAANGVVTTEARAAFDQALVEDPKQPIARFFQAIAVEQDGSKEKARQLWEALRGGFAIRRAVDGCRTSAFGCCCRSTAVGRGDRAIRPSSD